VKVLIRNFYNTSRGDRMTIVPLGDVHLGNAACDEKLFRSVVKRIEDDPDCYWFGMGDMCEFINPSDPRWDVASLASWIKMVHLGDLAKAQKDRFLEIVEPIAPKCLGLIEGNHEGTIKKYYERDIYSDIVTGIKEAGGFDADHQLALDYCGWLILRHYQRAEGERGGAAWSTRISLHHGFVGGKLAGAKALNMQRWLWTHDCDLAVFGHSHNASTQVEAVESIATSGRVMHQHRIGCYGGSFMNGAEYAVRKGYFPIPKTHIEIHLRPAAHQPRDRLRVVSGL